MTNTKPSQQIHPEHPKPGLYQLPKETYRTIEAVSTSSVKLACRSLADYLYFKYRSLPRSKGLDKGMALHLKLLDPQEFEQRIFAAPLEPKTTNAGKIRWIEFYLNEIGMKLSGNQQALGKMKADELRECLRLLETKAEVAGLLVLSAEDFDATQKMGESALRHPLMAELIEGGQTGLSQVWEDPQSGILLKSGLDYFDSEKMRLVDLKTTRDPSPKGFCREIANHLYHATAALQLDGFSTLFPQSDPELYFVAIGNTEPFVTEIYRLSTESVEEGRRRYQTALDKLKRFFDHYDIYPGYTDGGICELQLPSWAFQTDDCWRAL